MKKAIKTSFLYFIFAIGAGVFFREFTKINGFSGQTVLRVVHAHLFVLGTFLFLITALFCNSMEGFFESKAFHRFFITYNIALPFMVIMMLVRGVIQVLNVAVSNGVNAMISGIAGVSHILMTVALVMFFLSIKNISNQ